MGKPGDKVRVQIGWLVTEPVAAQYGWSFAPMTKARIFTLPAEDELRVRAFFQAIAASCGRTVEEEPAPKSGRRLFGRR